MKHRDVGRGRAGVRFASGICVANTIDDVPGPIPTGHHPPTHAVSTWDKTPSCRSATWCQASPSSGATGPTGLDGNPDPVVTAAREIINGCGPLVGPETSAHNWPGLARAAEVTLPMLEAPGSPCDRSYASPFRGSLMV
jgi:hypothetical protein